MNVIYDSDNWLRITNVTENPWDQGTVDPILVTSDLIISTAIVDGSGNVLTPVPVFTQIGATPDYEAHLADAAFAEGNSSLLALHQSYTLSLLLSRLSPLMVRALQYPILVIEG